MAFFSHMLNQSVTVKSSNLDSTTGQPSYGAGSEINARVEYSQEVSFGSSGADSQIADVVMTDTELEKGDKLVLPNGTEMEVKSVQEVPHLHSNEKFFKAIG